MKFKLFAILLVITTFSIYIITFNLPLSTGLVEAENYGYINKTGKLVIKPQFTGVSNFSQGLAAVEIGDKWRYINKTGKLVIKPGFSYASSFSEGLAAVIIGDKWGYIDGTGKVVIRPQFSEAYSFFEGIAAVEIDGKLSYIDKTGKQAIRLQFDGDFTGGGNFMYSDEREPGSFSAGLTAVRVYETDTNIYLGYFNKRGQLVIKTEFSEINVFSEALAAVETSDGLCGVRFDSCAYGYIDKTGKMVIEPKFFSSKEFSQGLAAVATDAGSGGATTDGDFIDKWGYINKRGRLVIKPKFSNANSFSEGLAAVEVGRRWQVYVDDNPIPGTAVQIAGQWGYIDSTGKQVIATQFDLVNSFSEGLAAVKVKDKCGYINKIGKVAVKRRFSTCADFSEGLAAVETVIR